MPYFICPHCAWRGNESSRTQGFSNNPKSCDRCGFAFLFELLDDFYPSPLSGMLVCDQQGRILGLGKGARELTGFDETELIGVDLEEALELRGDEDKPPHRTALEWGVRVLGKQMTMRNADGTVLTITADFLPAYDHDGGLLAVLTPRAV